MKKVLFVSYALPPYLYPQSIQIGRLIDQLKSQYDTYILTAEEDVAHDPTLYPDFYASIGADKVLRVPYRKHRHLARLQTMLLPLSAQRPDLQRNWADRAYAASIEKFSGIRFDWVVTFSFPLSLNLLGERLKQQYKCPWIAHQSDPWADNPFMNFGPLARRINLGMEQTCFRQAARLVFTSPEAADFYKVKYPDLAERISWINHSFPEGAYPEPVENNTDKKVIRYIGSFYGERTAKPLLGALKNLSPERQKKLCFEVVGAGLKTRLMLHQAGLPADLIRCVDRVSYGESLSLMRSSDALLVIDAPLERDNIFFPSKLADYIGAQRPIIGLSSPGPTSRILKSLGYECLGFDDEERLGVLLGQVADGNYPARNLSEDQLQPYTASRNADLLRGIIDHA